MGYFICVFNIIFEIRLHLGTEKIYNHNLIEKQKYQINDYFTQNHTKKLV